MATTLKFGTSKTKTYDVNTLKLSEKMNSEQEEKQMKYSCKFCDFHWEGTAGTFDAVRIHEKTHEEKKQNSLDE